jgi:hypothetical protein
MVFLKRETPNPLLSLSSFPFGPPRLLLSAQRNSRPSFTFPSLTFLFLCCRLVQLSPLSFAAQQTSADHISLAGPISTRAAQLFRDPAAHQLSPSLLLPTGGPHLSGSPSSTGRFYPPLPRNSRTVRRQFSSHPSPLPAFKLALKAH